MEKKKVSIREYRETDVPVLTALWNEVFYDDIALIGRFFELLPKLGRGYVADVEGEIIGMAYVLNLFLEQQKFGYIYAVAVKEEYRSRSVGTALLTRCRKDTPKLCTFPATDSLYQWYQSKLGMTYLSHCRYEKIPPKDSEGAIKVLSASEYAARRSEYNPAVRYPIEWYEYQRELCRTYGGGMFAYGRAIACGYIENGVLKISECLGSADFIPMLCSRLGADHAEIRRVSFEGNAYICSNSPISDTLDFGLALD
ncbi:MAG: GNAT family N-acetyltransferase [Oscillospiraceae bacterium]|nr:GNAT family N-acetyltransferase [Oscillospiraceae bacterium]